MMGLRLILLRQLLNNKVFNMKRITILCTTCAIVLLVTYALMPVGSNEPTILIEDAQAQVNNSSEGEVWAIEVESPSVEATPVESARYEVDSEQAPERVLEETVSLETVRDDISNNPHDTPKSLEKFAAQVSFMLKYARKDVVKAKSLFKRLDSCASTNQEGVPKTVRAYCASVAEELGETFPKDLGSDYAALRDRLPKEIRILYQ